MNRHIGASAYTLGGELHSFLSLPTSLPSQRRSRRTLRPSALKTSEAGADLEGFINFKALSPCKPFSHRVHRAVRAKAASHPEQGRQTSGSRPTQNALLVEPLSVLDVDAELWQVLDLCSDEELEAVYSVLHAPSPFSPVVKSLVTENEPPLLLQRGRLSLMHKIESRFRFLAADQASLFRGARPCYRDTLLAIRDRMDVPCSTNLSTFDLETEVFLHVLNNCLEYVQSDGMSGNPNEAAARATMQDGDGMSSSSPKRPNWVERATAPIMFGFKELLPTLAKLGSAITVTAVGRSTASQLAQQLACSHLRYQAAARFVASAASRGVTSGSALAGWGKQAVLESAAKGLQAATARYSALQGALSFIGPVMWGWLAVDLAFKAIGTDYARVIRAVFILAQVRLLRTNGFTNPPEVQISSFSTVITDDGPVVLASQSDDLMDLWDEEERGTHGEGYGQGPTRALVGPGTELLGPGHGFDDGDDTDDPYTDCNNVYN